MSALHISVIANASLSAALAYLLWCQRKQVRAAKLATFVEMMAAISYGAAHKDLDVRFERMAFALKPMFGNIDAAEIRWRMLRAALIGYLGSGKPALADVVNGAGRLFILENVTGDDKAAEVWQHMDSMLCSTTPLSEQPELTEVFSGEDLKLAQLQLEADLLRLYEAALRRTKA